MHDFVFVRQAWFPTCRLESLIRMAGIGTGMCWAGERFELASTECIAVDCSKAERRGARQEMHGEIKALCHGD